MSKKNYKVIVSSKKISSYERRIKQLESREDSLKFASEYFMDRLEEVKKERDSLVNEVEKYKSMSTWKFFILLS